MATPADAVPRHVAIIMDGNGRWAKNRGLARIKGHEQGAEAVRKCVEACGELKIEFLTLYAFSAENWQRPKTEVLALMHLLERFLKEKTPELLEKNVRLQAIGRLTDLPNACQRQLHKSIERTAGNDGLTLILALSYGSRLEIIDGIKSLLRQIEGGHIDSAMIDTEMFSKHLYTRYIRIPICSSALRAKCDSRTSSSGNFPIPRCMSRRSSGRILPRKISRRRWRNLGDGNGATAASASRPRSSDEGCRHRVGQ